MGFPWAMLVSGRGIYNPSYLVIFGPFIGAPHNSIYNKARNAHLENIKRIYKNCSRFFRQKGYIKRPNRQFFVTIPKGEFFPLPQKIVADRRFLCCVKDPLGLVNGWILRKFWFFATETQPDGIEKTILFRDSNGIFQRPLEHSGRTWRKWFITMVSPHNRCCGTPFQMTFFPGMILQVPQTLNQ